MDANFATRPRVPAHKTSVSVVDSLLGGGAASGGANLIFGTIGSGKTTLATMIAAEGASQASAAGFHCGKWLYLTTSQRPAEIANTAVSYLARIDRDLASSNCVLSGVAAHQDRNECENRPESYMPPHLRWIGAKAVIAVGLDIVEAELNETSCENFEEQLLRHIQRHCIVNNISGLFGVVIDDMHTLFSQHFRFGKVTPDQKLFSHNICRAISRIAFDICRSHGCALWMVYPLAEGRFGDKPLYSPTHRDALECRKLGNVISSAIVLGRRLPQTSIVLARCTMSPFPERNSEPVMLEFSNAFASLEVTDKYQIDHRGELRLNSADRDKPIMDETAEIELRQFLETHGNIDECGKTIERRDSTSGRIRRRKKS